MTAGDFWPPMRAIVSEGVYFRAPTSTSGPTTRSLAAFEKLAVDWWPQVARAPRGAVAARATPVLSVAVIRISSATRMYRPYAAGPGLVPVTKQRLNQAGLGARTG